MIEMVKVKTELLTGRALDYAVAISDGWNSNYLERYLSSTPNYSDWRHCGPLIDSSSISLMPDEEIWSATTPILLGDYCVGDTPQIAICRAVVASCIGDEVDIPRALLLSVVNDPEPPEAA